MGKKYSDTIEILECTDGLIVHITQIKKLSRKSFDLEEQVVEKLKGDEPNTIIYLQLDDDSFHTVDLTNKFNVEKNYIQDSYYNVEQKVLDALLESWSNLIKERKRSI